MLQDKIALVTGISSGIGLASAKRFLKEGAKVIGVGENCDELKNLGDNFRFLACDVKKEEDVLAVCKTVEAEYEKLDILLTICDKLYSGKITEVDAAYMTDASKHIVIAPMLFTKNLLPLLRKSSAPSVIHDISVEALLMDEDVLVSTMNVSLVNYVRQCASQLRPIRVNGVMFGLIKGHLLSAAKEAKYTDPKAAALIPAKRLGTPEDIAGVNAFMASEKSKYVNSSIFQADGGLYTMNARCMGNSY